MKRSELTDLIREVVQETIRKVGSRYVVYPEKGGKRLGTHSTKAAAERQLAAIHLNKENVHAPVRPGILKNQIKGKVTCSKAKALKAKQKDKSNNTAKAAQRFLNYHDC